MKRVTVIGGVLLLAATAMAAGTPEQKCQGGKNEAAGKLAACLAKAEKKLVLSGDGSAYAEAVSKCTDKFDAKWQKLEEAATAAGADCPDSTTDTAIGDFVDACSDAVATALAGGTLIQDPVSCAADLTTCNSDYGTCSSSLTSCNGSLGTCNSNYSTCSGNLSTCNTSYSACSGSLATCNGGTATAADVLAGKTFSSSAGLGVTGTAAAGGNVSGADGAISFGIPDGLYTGAKTCTAADSDLTAANIKNGKTIFGVTGTLSAGGLPESGQTTSYGTGSDGAVQAGTALSYTDNGNGTITDNVTGLMWEKKDDSGGIHDKDNGYTWGMTSSPYTMNGTMVTTFLANLNAGGGFAGYTDWRIPNAKELQSIVNYENVNPSVDAAFHKSATCGGCADVTAAACSCTASDDYWSSSTYRNFPSSAWGVYFFVGSVGALAKSSTYKVRAVRGGL